MDVSFILIKSSFSHTQGDPGTFRFPFVFILLGIQVQNVRSFRKLSNCQRCRINRTKTDGQIFLKPPAAVGFASIVLLVGKMRFFAGSWCAHVCLEQCRVDLVPANAQSALCTILVRKWIDSFKQSIKPVKLFICESSWGGRGGSLFLTLSLTVIFPLFAYTPDFMRWTLSLDTY